MLQPATPPPTTTARASVRTAVLRRAAVEERLDEAGRELLDHALGGRQPLRVGGARQADAAKAGRARSRDALRAVLEREHGLGRQLRAHALAQAREAAQVAVGCRLAAPDVLRREDGVEQRPEARRPKRRLDLGALRAR